MAATTAPITPVLSPFQFPDRLPGIGEPTQDIRVANGTPAMNLATIILRRLLQGGVCRLVAVGAGSVNQACKSIANVRSLYQKEMDDTTAEIMVIPEFTTIAARADQKPNEVQPTEHSALQLLVFAAKGQQQEEAVQGADVPVRVGQFSRAPALGLGIASRVRNNPQHFAVVQGVGPRSTNQALKAIVHCRAELNQVDLDALAVPALITIPPPSKQGRNGEQQHTAIQWRVFAFPIAEGSKKLMQTAAPGTSDPTTPESLNIKQDKTQQDQGDDLKTRNDQQPVQTQPIQPEPLPGRSRRRGRNQRQRRNRRIQRAQQEALAKKNGTEQAEQPQQKLQRTHPHPPAPPGVKLTICPGYRADDQVPDDSDIVAELTVASSTDTRRLAGAIAQRLRDGQCVRVRAVGPQSVSQSTKAIATARQTLRQSQIDISVHPTFVKVHGSRSTSGGTVDRMLSAVRFTLFPLHPTDADLAFFADFDLKKQIQKETDSTPDQAKTEQEQQAAAVNTAESEGMPPERTWSEISTVGAASEQEKEAMEVKDKDANKTTPEQTTPEAVEEKKEEASLPVHAPLSFVQEMVASATSAVMHIAEAVLPHQHHEDKHPQEGKHEKDHPVPQSTA